MLCEHLIKTNVLQIYIEDQQPSKASSGLASQCNNEDSKSMMLVTYATGIKSSVNLDNNTRRERKFIANSHSGKTKAMFFSLARLGKKQEKKLLICNRTIIKTISELFFKDAQICV